MALAQGWPIKTLSITSIALDLANVRIPGENLTEDAIARYLVESADLLDLTRDILRDGYLDNELPLVVAEGSKHVVLEGNRRITALKAIARPGMLGAAATRVERLKSRYSHGATPTRVRVMVAPSREAAQPLLARLHTRNPKKSWVREQMAIFYHAQLSESVTVDDLRVQYPAESGQMLAFIRMGEMRTLIRKMKFDDDELRDFVLGNEIKMTAFEYVYEPKRIQEALGLNFDQHGLLPDKKMSEGQARALTYVLGRLKDGTLNTRSPELKARNDAHGPFVALIEALVEGKDPETTTDDDAGGDSTDDGRNDDAGGTGTGEKASGSRGGSGSGGSGSGGSGSGATSGQGAGATGGRGPNRGNTRTRLDTSGFEYGGTSAGMRRRFEELRGIDVKTYPNAAHDLLRTVLECSIKEFLAAEGKPMAPGKMLGACITEVAKHFATAGNARMTTVINSINRKGQMSANQFAGTASALNSSNHEPDHFVEGSDVHEAWDRIKPLLVEMVGR